MKILKWNLWNLFKTISFQYVEGLGNFMCGISLSRLLREREKKKERERVDKENWKRAKKK